MVLRRPTVRSSTAPGPHQQVCASPVRYPPFGGQVPVRMRVFRVRGEPCHTALAAVGPRSPFSILGHRAKTSGHDDVQMRGCDIHDVELHARARDRVHDPEHIVLRGDEIAGHHRTGEAIEDTCPLEDRVDDRRVFQGLNVSTARQAMSRACRLAKIPHYSPHDLRHRRLTLWHQSGVPARELAERAGHSKPSMSLDVYTHVMPVAEVAEGRCLALLTAD